jgi:hypothetical protein
MLRAVNFFGINHTDAAEDLTDVTVVSTDLVDDEIDGLVIDYPTLSILSKKLSVMEVSNDATEA